LYSNNNHHCFLLLTLPKAFEVILCYFEVLKGSSMAIALKSHRLGGDFDAEANRLGIKSTVKCFNDS